MLNSCFGRPLEIFLARYYNTGVFFSVCCVLVLVTWAFSLCFLKPQARCYNCFNLDVSGNGGSKRELSISYSENTIAVLCLLFHSWWLSLVLCLAKIQNRILLMDTELTVVVVFKINSGEL